MNKSTLIRIWFRHMVSFILLRSVLCALLPVVAFSQTTQPQNESVEALINQVKQGKFSALTLDQLIRLQATRAIPSIEEQFIENGDRFIKEALASALVRLGDKDRMY